MNVKTRLFFFILMLVSSNQFIFSQVVSTSSCEQLFNQHYNWCETTRETSYAVAAATLTKCLVAASFPPSPFAYAQCGTDYGLDMLNADVTFNQCVELAADWYFVCIEL